MVNHKVIRDAPKGTGAHFHWGTKGAAAARKKIGEKLILKGLHKEKGRRLKTRSIEERDPEGSSNRRRDEHPHRRRGKLEKKHRSNGLRTRRHSTGLHFRGGFLLRFGRGARRRHQKKPQRRGGKNKKKEERSRNDRSSKKEGSSPGTFFGQIERGRDSI